MRTPEQIKEYQKAYRETHRDKYRQYAKKYRENHRDVPHHLKRKYGITPDDKVRMYDSQKGLCAVCQEPLKGIWDRDSCVDHNHSTGKVRGIIHWYCNILVGVMEAKPILLTKIVSYLDSN